MSEPAKKQSTKENVDELWTFYSNSDPFSVGNPPLDCASPDYISDQISLRLFPGMQRPAWLKKPSKNFILFSQESLDCSSCVVGFRSEQ